MEMRGRGREEDAGEKEEQSEVRIARNAKECAGERAVKSVLAIGSAFMFPQAARSILLRSRIPSERW